jgi:hypothetical protein
MANLSNNVVYEIDQLKNKKMVWLTHYYQSNASSTEEIHYSYTYTQD